MAAIDLDVFLKVKGTTGTGALQALGMSYGMPSCLLNLASDVLSILPSPVLSDIQSQVIPAKAKANELTKEVFKKLSLDTGIIEFDTDSGLFKFKSDSSWYGLDNDQTKALNNLAGVLGAFEYASTFAAQIYQNYTGIKGQIDAIKSCLDKFNELKSFEKGNSSTQKATLSQQQINELFDKKYAGDIQKLNNATTFINSADSLLDSIESIILERKENPDLEPKFLDSSELDQFLDGTEFERYPLIDPNLDGTAGDDAQNSVFRLTYEPPVSLKGKYVLSNDGLYYDSLEGGFDEDLLGLSGIPDSVLAIINSLSASVDVGDLWKYNYPANLGGKGDAISVKILNETKNALFNPEIIDDSVGIKKYYEEDHFLAVLNQQRDKHVYDLSADLVDYIATYGEDSSIVINQRKLISAEIVTHNLKINKRKKQIEIAVKAPQIFDPEQTEPLFAPGNIPINDFSYLANYDFYVALEKQKKLIFKQGDVTGIVLPIEPKFVSTFSKQPKITFDNLVVPTVGKGSILYTPSSVNAGTILSLNDQITNDGLFAIYNFLNTDIVLPSSVNFKTTNCATDNMYNNAQLVAPATSAIFFSGLAIPYLEGIVKNKSSDPVAASGLGSYLRLPQTQEFRDLTYSPSGFTLECWVHVPNILDGEVGWLSSTTSSLTKVLFSSENVGSKTEDTIQLDEEGNLLDLDYLNNDKGDQFVRGVLCGFTRDRRITQENTGYSNNNYDNDPVSSLSFFLAPTISRDLSSASFINKNKDECKEELATFYKMKVDLDNTNFGNVSSQFVLIDITCDPQNNEIKFYADGSLVVTSALSDVFGVSPGQPIQVPTFKKENSFEYSETTVDGPTTLKQGPKLDNFYTPWIIGGGYTDGMYKYGNFLGGDRSGVVSGLRGHIGSLKFYSKPLNSSEVDKNYKAQKGFFKTIRI